MNNGPDTRIPIVMGGKPGPNDALLVEDGQTMPATGYAVRFTLARAKPGHITGCTCCTPRSPAAGALTTLFQSRARATAPFFTRVTALASPAGQAAIRAAVATDVVASARFRVLDDFERK
jgi:hypothetical protein